MDSSAPKGTDPKTSRVPVVPLEKMVEQELAVKRAKLAAERATPSRPGQRWLALMAILLILLAVMVGGFIWGWGRIQNYKAQTQQGQPPPAASGRR